MAEEFTSGLGTGPFGSAPFGTTVESADAAGVSETVTVTEQLIVSQAKTVNVAEDYGISEKLQTGFFQVENVGGFTIRVTFPMELHFDGVGTLSNYILRPDLEGSFAVPLEIEKAQPRFTTHQVGSSGSAVPRFNGSSYDLDAGTTTHFKLHGRVTNVNLGDFVRLSSGKNAGLYQIQSVIQQGFPEAIVELDQPLSLLDDDNGVFNLQTGISGSLDFKLLDISEDVYTFRCIHPSVTPSTPLRAVYRVVRLAREASTQPALNATSPPPDDPFVSSYTTTPLEQLTFTDYRTFKFRDTSMPVLRGATLTDIVDRFSVVFQTQSSVTWAHTSGVEGVDLVTSKMTNGGDYLAQVINLFDKFPQTPYQSDLVKMKAQQVPLPRVLAVDVLPDEGVITVTFNEEMSHDDDNLNDPSDYTISGAFPVHVARACSCGERQVFLKTVGLMAGDYTLTISTSTPKDVAGNPLDPTFNTAIFTGSIPLTNRSIFTDKGPIAKPPLTLQSGTAATLDEIDAVTLPGAVFTVSDVGKYVRLANSSANDGEYRILSIIDTDQATLQSQFNLPDANDGAIDWEVVDQRYGQIADDPSDVSVFVNGVETTPEAVIGLLGQIVLSSNPLPTGGQVTIDYTWCPNPRVEVRRLNSQEFRFNAWNRDVGGQNNSSHHYRYNNVLIVPSDYDPDDIQASLDQPQLRELKYRAYERAYTAVFNDPTKLLFNTPNHKIAFPPASRPLEETAVFYEGTVLPEVDTTPWERLGAGSAVAVAGNLVVVDNSSGTFPTGQPLFWTQGIDVSFTHVFSAAWRCSIDSVTSTEGVWVGIAAGYSTELTAYVVGYLDVGGVKKIGFLKRDAEDSLSEESAWTGGLVSDVPTNAPVDFDWSILHSYRLFTDLDGVVKLFVDGDVVETLRITPGEAPFLEEMNAPFDEIQGVFFGSLSRPAESTSTWDFYRYLVQPTNAQQVSPSSFVTYEGNVVPETDPSPWTPVGFHGTGTILGSENLLLDSTSATDVTTASEVGLVGGDFRGYVKIEPLLGSSSQFAMDMELSLLTHTHGIDPDGLMFAVDDGTRLMQMCFLPDTEMPRFSYGGRSFPDEFSPYVWSSLGTQTAEMRGRILRITDSAAGDGLVYFIEDLEPSISDDRVVASTRDYILETRLEVVSYTVDGSGFAGAFAQVYDSLRSVGLLLQEDAGVRYVALHSDGTTLGAAARFAFEWNDGAPHTYRLRYSASGNLVSVFADGAFLGSFAYSSFTSPPVDPIGQVSFGSSTIASAASSSVVDWYYCNAWRVEDTVQKRFVGLWKGSDSDSLIGYHLPLKAAGQGAVVAGNGLGDPLADFVSAGVAAGDYLIVDSGANKGVYELAGVTDAQNLTIPSTWPLQPSVVDYRIVRETDWTVQHKYRLFRDPTGTVQVFFDNDATPLIAVNYDSIDLPVSATGIVRTLSGGLAAVAFGSFSPEHLAQSSWDYVRYGITLSSSNLRIVPPHQILNQWNVMESPERLFTVVAHDLTDFKSSSTGITPQTDPDFLDNTAVSAFTQLNQDTPLVPETQAFENRGPYVTQTFISAFNDPEDVLNSTTGFILNDGSTKFEMVVPNDVLYSCLKVTETSTGELQLIAPFDDDWNPSYGALYYQNEVCLEYTADTLPESDTTAPTPWTLNSDDPGEVSTSVLSGILTYGTSATGTRTAYLNNTPLPDAPSLQSEATFRLRLDQDTTSGTGDSGVRFGLSAPGMTVGLGFVTLASGERNVLVFDINSGAVMGRATVDYLDGNYHTYRIVRIPSEAAVEVYIDS